MFYMYNISGMSSTYTPGAIRATRRIVDSASKVQSVDGISEGSQLANQSENPILREYQKFDAPPQKRERAITAEQIMTTPVKVLSITSTIAEAKKLISKERLRHVPVVSADDRLVGILSDRDLFRSTLEGVADSTGIDQIMASPVLSSAPGSRIRDIAQVLFQERIGAMPVVSEEEKVVGIITRSDILRTLINRAPLDLWL